MNAIEVSWATNRDYKELSKCKTHHVCYSNLDQNGVIVQVQSKAFGHIKTMSPSLDSEIVTSMDPGRKTSRGSTPTSPLLRDRTAAGGACGNTRGGGGVSVAGKPLLGKAEQCPGLPLGPEGVGQTPQTWSELGGDCQRHGVGRTLGTSQGFSRTFWLEPPPSQWVGDRRPGRALCPGVGICRCLAWGDTGQSKA